VRTVVVGPHGTAEERPFPGAQRDRHRRGLVRFHAVIPLALPAADRGELGRATRAPRCTGGCRPTRPARRGRGAVRAGLSHRGAPGAGLASGRRRRRHHRDPTARGCSPRREARCPTPRTPAPGCGKSSPARRGRACTRTPSDTWSQPAWTPQGSVHGRSRTTSATSGSADPGRLHVARIDRRQCECGAGRLRAGKCGQSSPVRW
jgi:hypothetical protein